MVEIGFRGSLADTSYLLDGEVLRVNLSASRDLSPEYFVTGEGWLGGSYNGFLDGFLDWYHDLFGVVYPERENRPKNSFAYFYRDVAGRRTEFEPKGFGIGDLRLGIGRRHTPELQSVFSVTVPTGTLGEGFARKVPSFNLLNTYRAAASRRLIFEGSANLGYTPTHGELSRFQNQVFFLGTGGFRWRTIGGLWTFANLFLHTPYYSSTGARQLDKADFTIDFGWMIRGKGGQEFRFGMTEDLWPSGAAIDADFRVGYSW
jgi:hypothetical protein